MVQNELKNRFLTSVILHLSDFSTNLRNTDFWGSADPLNSISPIFFKKYDSYAKSDVKNEFYIQKYPLPVFFRKN